MKKLVTTLAVLLLIVISISSQIPTDGLVAYYPFNGNANDESVYGNDGTIIGATLTEDRNGNANSALSFDGDGDRVNCGSDNRDIDDQLTISLWMKSSDLEGFILAKYNNLVRAPGYHLNIRPEGNLLFAGRDSYGGDYIMCDSPESINDDKWHHVVSTVDYKQWNLWVDGKNINSIESASESVNFNNDIELTIGYLPNDVPPRDFAGIVDDIRIYNRLLSSTEIEGIYYTEKTLSVMNYTVMEADQFILPISVSELSATDNIIAYQFDIDYDDAVLVYAGTDLTGTLAEGGTVEVNTSVAGKLSISYMNSTALVGAGYLIKLQFNSLKVDTTFVSISDAYLNSSLITNLTNGIVTITNGTPPTAAITYDDTENRCGDELLITATFDEPMLEANAVKLSLSGAASLTDIGMTRVTEIEYTLAFVIPNSDGEVTLSLSNGTDLSSNEIVAAPTSGATFNIIPIVYGDIDEDGSILAYDAALTLQYSVGIDPLPDVDSLPWESWRDTTANVDGDGAVTANDAGLILQYSAGIITGFDGEAKKSASYADVTVEVVDNEIVFYSNGNLIGLNLSSFNENQILGTPDIVAENYMSAVNMEGTSYKVGLCTANPLIEGEILLKIPFNASGSASFDMNINAEQKSVTVDLATGLIGMADISINIYPNPVGDVLKISGLKSKASFEIYSINGQLLISRIVNKELYELNVSELPSGIYILKLNIDNEILDKRFTKE